MPFYCGKRSAGICVVLGFKNPQRIPANTLPVFSSLRSRICQRLLRLATKDYSDRLLVHEKWHYPDPEFSQPGVRHEAVTHGVHY